MQSYSVKQCHTHNHTQWKSFSISVFGADPTLCDNVQMGPHDIVPTRGQGDLVPLVLLSSLDGGTSRGSFRVVFTHMITSASNWYSKSYTAPWERATAFTPFWACWRLASR